MFWILTEHPLGYFLQERHLKRNNLILCLTNKRKAGYWPTAAQATCTLLAWSAFVVLGIKFLQTSCLLTKCRFLHIATAKLFWKNLGKWQFASDVLVIWQTLPETVSRKTLHVQGQCMRWRSWIRLAKFSHCNTSGFSHGDICLAEITLVMCRPQQQYWL